MQLYCSLPPKNVLWNVLSSGVEAVTALLIPIMQPVKLTVPKCSESKASHHTAAQREEKGTGAWGGPCESGTEGSQPKSAVLRAHLLRTMCFFWPAFAFLQLCSEYAHSGTSSARPVFKNPKCQGLSRAPHSGLWRLLTKSISSRTRASGACGVRCRVVLLFYLFVCLFSFQVSAGQLCNVSLGFRFDIPLSNNAIHITLKWEKCKVVFPFYLWILKSVLLVWVWSGLILYCFGRVAPMASLHQALSPSEDTRSPARATVKLSFRERSATSLTFLVVWILYHLCMFANIKLLHVLKWAFFILNFICLQIYFFNKISKPSFSTY